LQPAPFAYRIGGKLECGMGGCSDRDKHAAVDAGLKGMFRALERRPLPDRLSSLVEQLDDGTPVEQPKKKAG
jgi:hypothetical protein